MKMYMYETCDWVGSTIGEKLSLSEKDALVLGIKEAQKNGNTEIAIHEIETDNLIRKTISIYQCKSRISWQLLERDDNYSEEEEKDNCPPVGYRTCSPGYCIAKDECAECWKKYRIKKNNEIESMLNELRN